MNRSQTQREYLPRAFNALEHMFPSAIHQKITSHQPNSLTVQEGWTGIVRMYPPVDVQENIDYIESVRGIAPEKL